MDNYQVICQYVIPVIAGNEGEALEKAADILLKVSPESLKMWLILKAQTEKIIASGDMCDIS